MNSISTHQPLTRLNIFSFKGVQMRTFHITWLTFFFSFFAWFGMASLMPLAKEQLHLTKDQLGNIQTAFDQPAGVISFSGAFSQL